MLGDDLPLFSVPVHTLHRPGQSTSKRALEKTIKPRASLAAAVLERVKVYGESGAIPEQLEDFWQLIDVRRAFHVLKRKGLIEATGEERDNSKGNACTVWRAKP